MSDILKFTFRPYRRPFTRPLRAAWGKWSVREGWIIRLADETGMARFGEVAPLETFGSESLAEAGNLLTGFPPEASRRDFVTRLDSLPPATAFGLWTALEGNSSTTTNPVPTARSSTLLSLDDNAPGLISALRGKGRTVFKLKLGLADKNREWEQLQRVYLALEPGERLRLDPNRSWNPDDWSFWKPRLNGLSERIDFVEEPFPASLPASELRSLAASSPVAFALDESLCFGNIDEWIGLEWPGYWIIKPSIMGNPHSWLSQLSNYKARTILSSSIETAIGLSAVIRLAAAFPDSVHGLGIQAFFEDDWGVEESGDSMKAMESGAMEALWSRLPEN